ncbi:MAG: TetR/AcrR family transcriptional regulator [Solirubrobacteraceae bacterium]
MSASSAPNGRTGIRERTRQTILETALRILTEKGYSALTIEGIAAESGIAKTTIYRGWSSKAAIVIDAIAPIIEAVNPHAPKASDSLRDDLRAAIHRIVDLFTTQVDGSVIAGLLADFSRDPEMADAYRQRIVRSRREAVSAVLTEWQQRGIVREGLDLELVQDLYVGPIYYRVLVTGAPIDDPVVESLLDVIIAHVAVDPTGHPRLDSPSRAPVDPPANVNQRTR